MKVIIHSTLKRPWGNETPYTCVDDDGKIYNGFLPQAKVTDQDIIDEITRLKQLRVNFDESKEELIARKAELEAEVEDLTQKIAIKEAEEQVAVK